MRCDALRRSGGRLGGGAGNLGGCRHIVYGAAEKRLAVALEDGVKLAHGGRGKSTGDPRGGNGSGGNSGPYYT